MNCLVTGGAGFIGSNIVEELLKRGENVRVLDNLSTGKRENLRFNGQLAINDIELIEGDIRDLQVVKKAVNGMDIVLHQAALPSVPRSIKDPITTNEVNVGGTLNVLKAAVDADVKRVVYASSSSVYGDSAALPKHENMAPNPLSPYAVSKLAGEKYCIVFSKAYGLETVPLRYFNVFGPRQDPEGAYAAVMPKWFSALRTGGEVYIYGDGETSRDFCFVENVVQANLLAATTDNKNALNQAYNVAYGGRTTLNELFSLIRGNVAERDPSKANEVPVYLDFRSGDIRHSRADIGRAKTLLGYEPQYSVEAGLKKTAKWYLSGRE